MAYTSSTMDPLRALNTLNLVYQLDELVCSSAKLSAIYIKYKKSLQKLTLPSQLHTM